MTITDEQRDEILSLAVYNAKKRGSITDALTATAFTIGVLETIKLVNKLCDLHIISNSDDEEMKEDCTYCENEREYYNSLLEGTMPCCFCNKTDNSQR